MPPAAKGTSPFGIPFSFASIDAGVNWNAGRQEARKAALPA